MWEFLLKSYRSAKLLDPHRVCVRALSDSFKNLRVKSEINKIRVFQKSQRLQWDIDFSWNGKIGGGIQGFLKFQKCLINYLVLSYEQTVMSQLYLLVNHHRGVVNYYNLYDIHEKFEYSCEVSNKAHPHPLLACLLFLKGPTFLY